MANMAKAKNAQPKKELKPKPKLTIRAQTADEEFDYLWSVLQKMPFYNEKGYSVELPDNPEFQNLAQNPGAIRTVSKDDLRQLFTQQIYDPSFFVPGLNTLNTERHRIEATFPDFQLFNSQWGFKLFQEYQIHLTRYGSGGDYDPSAGVVRILTRADGSFKRPHPAHSAVHEITHIGIEDSVVKKFGLTHWEKERVVDKICLLEFSEILPGYKSQDKGDRAVDPYVTDETIENLPQAIKQYVSAKPREK